MNGWKEQIKEERKERRKKKQMKGGRNKGRINRQRKGFLGHSLKCRGVSKLRGSPTQNHG